MRSVRSSFATTRIAPSSTFFRPIFHCSPTRNAYCSTVSGAVVGTIRTAIWLPLRASNERRSCSSEETCSGFSVPVRSVTRPFSGGTAICAHTETATSKTNRARNAFTDSLELLLLLLPEIDLGRLGDLALVLDGEIGLGLVAECHRGQVRGELTHGDVVLLNRLDVAVACDRDAVLRALELRLQIAEVGVRLELRIVLRDHQEPRKRARQLALRLLEALKSLRVVDELRSGLDRSDARTRLGNAREHVHLLLGEGLDRLHQVRHEVRAALILVQHLGPGGLGLLVGALDGVVAAAGEEEQQDDRYGADPLVHEIFHFGQNFSLRIACAQL